MLLYGIEIKRYQNNSETALSMASSVKGPKDKPHNPAPRLIPRPTAASAARAARIATNRNLVSTTNSKRTINRTSTSPSKLTITQPPAKVKCPPTPVPKIQDAQYKEPDPDGKIRPATAKKTQDAHKESNPEVLIETLHNNDPPIYTDNEQILVSFEHVTVSKCVSNFKDDETVNFNETTKNLDLIIEDSINQENNDETFEITRDDDSESTHISRVSESLEHSVKTELDSPNSSRPVTPAPKSVPQTPKQLSRPQTPQSPRIPSRPVTPCHPGQRTGTPSRPLTPQRGCATPKKLKESPAPHVRPRSRTADSNGDQPSARASSQGDDDDLMATFAAKQKQFHDMKKDLDLKQQMMLEFYEGLKSLHQRLADEGSPPDIVQLQELVVFNIADWTAEEVSELCRDAAAAYCTDGAADFVSNIELFDDSSMLNLDQQVLELPTRFADLCLKAFTARQEVIDWVKDMVQNEDAQVGSGEAVGRIAVYNMQGLEFCESLRELKRFSDVAVESLTQLSRRAVLDRRALLAVGEKLVREVAQLREQVKQVKESVADRNIEPLSGDLEAIRQELEEERLYKAQAKDKLVTTEQQLRQARQRIAKMDRQLRESEASIASLTGTVKTLEDQSRQKEVQLEAKARKLRELLKTGEMTNSQIAQQRNALQAEVQDLKEQIANMTKEHKAAVQELNKTIKELNLSVEEQKAAMQKNRDIKIATEEALGNSQILVEELKAKLHHLETTKANPELPSEKEIVLWSELQAVRETLRATEVEVTACKREKIRFLETLTKIGDSDNSKVGMQQKLAAELVTKEEIIEKMQLQLKEFTKSLRLNEQKVAQYEKFVRDLVEHQKAAETNQDDFTDYANLQQEIMTIRMELLSAAQRNEELEQQLALKEQQLEQQDKTSRAQARVIKVREELINLLKKKETEQGRELAGLQQDLEQRMKVVDEVNRQIASKADEIQELFTTLESKQQQIHRLEKIVLALEEQQRRAQAQRTRHEEKIAALERELAAAGPHRERKFLFF